MELTVVAARCNGTVSSTWNEHDIPGRVCLFINDHGEASDPWKVFPAVQGKVAISEE